LARNDLADAGCGDPDGLGQSVLADAQGFQELLLKKFTRADRWETIHGEMSVVVNKFNVFGAAVRPSKAEPILIIDANAVLSGPITAQRLQAVTGRNPEVVELVGDLELPQLAASHSLEGLKARDRPTAGEGSGVGTSE
jgi:hypothetical protein